MPHPWFQLIFEGSQEKSARLAEVYAAMASFVKVPFFDAGSVISTDGVDGLHLTAQANATLGQALAEEVTRILGES